MINGMAGTSAWSVWLDGVAAWFLVVMGRLLALNSNDPFARLGEKVLGPNPFQATNKRSCCLGHPPLFLRKGRVPRTRFPNGPLQSNCFPPLYYTTI